MADRISPERRSANMRAIRSKDMKPGMIVRRLVHGMGYRYPLHRKDLPGRPDLVFGPRKKVIFVHGCFWHLHGDPACVDARIPGSNKAYWEKKLHRNVERDREHIAALKQQGWNVLVIWECETAGEGALKRKIRRFLG